MTVQEVQKEALNLSASERAEIAKVLWSSIEEPQASEHEERLLEEAVRRGGELKSGQVEGRSHAQVMQAARKAIF